MISYHTLRICGLERQLPIKAVSKNTKLASFNILGDAELVDAVAEEMYKRLRKYTFDVIIGPESKVVPLLHELAQKFNHSRYVVCRKSIKPHMISPVVLDPQPHFPRHAKRLVIDGKDVDFIKGKKVAIVDDVVSTGVTMRMMKELIKRSGASPAVLATILRQGEMPFDELDNLVYLETLPIFKEA